MKFLYTSTFRPLAFLGLLLVTATAFPTSAVLREDFTSDTTLDTPTYTSSPGEDQIRYALKEIKEIRNEMCHNDENCMEYEVAVSKNNLNLPKMAKKDGCFQIGHNQDTCLLKITSGFLEYQIYLKYIRDELKDEKASNVQSSTKTLIQILKEQVNPDKIILPSPTANAILLEKLKSQDKWQKTMTIHLILCKLQEFLQFTLRVIRKA